MHMSAAVHCVSLGSADIRESACLMISRHETQDAAFGQTAHQAAEALKGPPGQQHEAKRLLELERTAAEEGLLAPATSAAEPFLHAMAASSRNGADAGSNDMLSQR